MHSRSSEGSHAQKSALWERQFCNYRVLGPSLTSVRGRFGSVNRIRLRNYGSERSLDMCHVQVRFRACRVGLQNQICSPLLALLVFSCLRLESKKDICSNININSNCNSINLINLLLYPRCSASVRYHLLCFRPKKVSKHFRFRPAGLFCFQESPPPGDLERCFECFFFVA